MTVKAALLSSASKMIVPPLAEGNRYLPRSYGGRTTSGWGVWDAQEGRFVPDEELRNISVHDLTYANVQN